MTWSRQLVDNVWSDNQTESQSRDQCLTLRHPANIIQYHSLGDLYDTPL